MPGFYAPHLTPESAMLELDGDEFHHIVNVFRKQKGDIVLLTNGKGLLAHCEIVEISRKFLLLKIKESKQVMSSQPSLAVAFSLLRNKNDHLLVEKLTELGVKEFFPLLLQYTVRRSVAGIQRKLEKTAIAAIKQCDNAYLPRINEVTEFSGFVQAVHQKGYLPLVARERGCSINLADYLKNDPAHYCIVIGAEGGFSPAEVELMDHFGFSYFSLGNHVLRAETAAIAAVAQMLGYYLREDPDYY
ncbi:MAG: 16S rRNA (uracil(1498)-N(3))-methyltransferase [Candidatus Cloacimonetes bacterium]|nr:16S rRNA (uracil(1498)-N(3))-methyltransferase [Candidatus Cloacimonadota bacterium]